VRVFLNPDIPSPLTATQVKVMSAKHEGTVDVIDSITRTMTVLFEGGLTETVVVSTGATILKSTGGSQHLTSFENIAEGDYVEYFGLKGCADTKFYAFVIVVNK
jgi:hypothetical protein